MLLNMNNDVPRSEKRITDFVHKCVYLEQKRLKAGLKRHAFKRIKIYLNVVKNHMSFERN